MVGQSGEEVGCRGVGKYTSECEGVDRGRVEKEGVLAQERVCECVKCVTRKD